MYLLLKGKHSDGVLPSDKDLLITFFHHNMETRGGATAPGLLPLMWVFPGVRRPRGASQLQDPPFRRAFGHRRGLSPPAPSHEERTRALADRGRRRPWAIAPPEARGGKWERPERPDGRRGNISTLRRRLSDAQTVHLPRTSAPPPPPRWGSDGFTPDGKQRQQFKTICIQHVPPPLSLCPH